MMSVCWWFEPYDATIVCSCSILIRVYTIDISRTSTVLLAAARLQLLAGPLPFPRWPHVAHAPFSVQAGTARKHDSGVTALSWSADGLQLAASCEAGPDGASAVVVWALTADGGLSDQPSAWYRATVDEH